MNDALVEDILRQHKRILKNKLIEDFQIKIKSWRKMIHFYRDKGYPDEWKDNITKIRDDMNTELKKWEERKDG